MDDLVAFVRARLDEDEAATRAATAGPWTVNDPDYAEAIRSADGVDVVAGGRWGGEAPVFESTEDAVHIARHDPARVLREVEAKRRIVDRYDWLRDHGDTGDVAWVLPFLAAPFADHPDYRPEWAPSA